MKLNNKKKKAGKCVSKVAAILGMFLYLRSSDTTSCWPSSLRVSAISSRPWRVWWWCHRSWSSWPTACSATPSLTCGRARQVRRSRHPPHDIGVPTMSQTLPECFLASCAAVVCSQNKPTRSPSPGLPIPEASGLLGVRPASEDQLHAGMDL